MVLKSQFADVEIVDKPFHELLLEKIWSHGNKIALIEEQTNKSLSFHDVYILSYALSTSLRNRGFVKGEVALTCMPNCVEYPIVCIGTLLSGGTLSLANNNYVEAELKHQFNDSNTTYIFTNAECFVKVYEAALQLGGKIKEIFVVGDADFNPAVNNRIKISRFADLIAGQPDFSLPKIRFNTRQDLAVLPYSSGTTGLSKGVMLTHYNLAAILPIFVDHISNRFSNFFEHAGPEIGFLPMYHIFGFQMTNLHLWKGTLHLVMAKFDLDNYLSLIQKYRVPTVTVVPPVLILLAKHPLVNKYDVSSLEAVLVGAAPTGETICNELKARLPHIKHVLQGYGMTEMSLAGHFSMPGMPSACAGMLGPNFECKVIDVENGKELFVNKPGEICVRSPTIMKGYLNNDAATEATIDKDGWLHTGDIGYYDEKEHFYIVDRLKELIKVRGFQVAPAELEALLLSHPKISDAAVIGIADAQSGELPRAFVVRADASLTAEEVDSFVHGRVAHYKQLKGGIEFVAEIPKSPSGKILRRKLRDGQKVASKL